MYFNNFMFPLSLVLIAEKPLYGANPYLAALSHYPEGGRLNILLVWTILKFLLLFVLFAHFI